MYCQFHCRLFPIYLSPLPTSTLSNQHLLIAEKNFFEEKKTTQSENEGGEIFKRIELYLSECRKTQRLQVYMLHDANRAGNFYVRDEPRLGFVIRIRAIDHIDPPPPTPSLTSCSDVESCAADAPSCGAVPPWGYTGTKTVHDLIYERGYAKVSSRAVPVTDNSIVEALLFGHSLASRYE